MSEDQVITRVAIFEFRTSKLVVSTQNVSAVPILFGGIYGVNIWNELFIKRETKLVVSNKDNEASELCNHASDNARQVNRVCYIAASSGV
jgi:hypothetical protein